ncbi:MAG TPA: urease accessory protein UreD [Pseudolabrys sp.]|nr:urease accessory protein UreD [Pseudolabrys sp.]
MSASVLGSDEEIFAANRASGKISVAVGLAANKPRRTRVHEAGSLRVRFPHGDEDTLEAVILNTAGGMTGGDRFAIDIAVEAGARLLAGTAAAEKIYCSLGPDVELAISLNIDGSLAWLPQETILFDEARLSRRIDVDLARDATLLMAEAVVFGRSAMEETVVSGYLVDRWRVRRGGRLLFAETMRLDEDVAAKMAQPAIAAGAVAVATVLIVPGTDDNVSAVRSLSDRFAGEVGISSWNGIAVARLCARDGAALRHDLSAVLAALKAPLPRLWLT